MVATNDARVDAHDRAHDRPARKRRWYQIGMRSLLAAVTLAAILLGCWSWLIRPYQQQDEIRARILAVGGTCSTRPGPSYVQWVLGEGNGHVITEVNLYENQVLGSLYGFPYSKDQPARSDEYPQLLLDLGTLTEVEVIDVRGCDVTDEIVATWSELPKLSKLRLSNTLVEDASTWPDWPLWELMVEETPMESAGLRPIGKYTTLNRLYASGTGCDDETIAAWKVLRNLRVLDIRGTRYSLHSRPTLLAFPKMEALKFLNASYLREHVPSYQLKNGMPTELQDFPSIPEAEAWVRDHLFINQRPDAPQYRGQVVADRWEYPGGLEYELLPSLGIRPDVDSLNLASPQVDDETLECLAQFPNLHYLELRGAWITDAGLRHLQNCAQLEVLRLGNTRITDEGLEEVANCLNLKQLSLDGTRVTHVGLRHVARLKQLEELTIPPADLRGPEPGMIKNLPRISRYHVEQTGRWDRGSRLGTPLSLEDVQVLLEIHRAEFGMREFEFMAFPASEDWVSIIPRLIKPSEKAFRAANTLRRLPLTPAVIESLPVDVREELQANQQP